MYFRERGKEGEREEENINVREKHRVVASGTSPTGDRTHNPGMYPDQELNQ